MESLESQTNTDMEPTDNTESSRLISQNSNGTKINFFNLTNNVCALSFLGIITFCCFKNGVSLFSFHPILMTLGWMMFMTTAINSITPGDFATEWMPIRLRSARHWVIQLFAAIIVLIGFIVIVTNKFINSFHHFSTLHAKFGLASVIFMVITMLGGLCALYSLKLKHYLAPIYMKILHASVGIITFSLGIVTIILAGFSDWWKFGDILRYTNLILVLAVMLFTILRPCLKIYFRLREKLNNNN